MYDKFRSNQACSQWGVQEVWLNLHFWDKQTNIKHVCACTHIVHTCACAHTGISCVCCCISSILVSWLLGSSSLLKYFNTLHQESVNGHLGIVTQSLSHNDDSECRSSISDDLNIIVKLVSFDKNLQWWYTYIWS